jgi:hypothetical protein
LAFCFQTFIIIFLSASNTKNLLMEYEGVRHWPSASSVGTLSRRRQPRRAARAKGADFSPVSPLAQAPSAGGSSRPATQAAINKKVTLVT